MHRFILLLLLATSALAAHADTYFDNAYVRSVQPQYESVAVPRQQCTNQWINEPRRVERSRNYGGIVVGGLAGALVGNQVGNGHGREAATALGAVLGAFTGDRVGNRGLPGIRWRMNTVGSSSPPCCPRTRVPACRFGCRLIRWRGSTMPSC